MRDYDFRIQKIYRLQPESNPRPWYSFKLWRTQEFFQGKEVEGRKSTILVSYPNTPPKKTEKIFELHRYANPTPTTSHEASQPTVTEEPSGQTSMEIPLPNTPQASRPGTPEGFGPTFENCRKLQELTTIIDLYSTTLESTHLLKGVMQSGIKDPNNPIIRKETSYMELTNERFQQAVSEEAYTLTVSSNHSPSIRATELYREPHLRRQEHPSTGLITISTPVMTSPPSRVPHVR
ncbi:hypothetical protein TNCV_2438381 [Trichonephila clavipes]|nr:hypothetical protein TNCV_2438381 [Trichonephila clavipes]